MQRLPLASSHILRQLHLPFSVSLRSFSSLKHSLPTVQTHSSRILTARKYATMSQSHACCTVPPVVDDGYKEKGEYMTIDGMKTYAIYDIFGFFPQTLQGADILAHGDKDKQYQVFMPGMLHSKINGDTILT